MNGFEHIENIDNYLLDIEKYRPLTAKEERQIGEKIANGDMSEIDKLVNANLRFVVSVAKQYRGNGVPFDELISEGNLGLLTAAMRFDVSRGCKFITYAVYWIKSYINKRISESISEGTSGKDIYDSVKNEQMNYEEEDLILRGISAKTAVDEISSCLKEREYQMISMYFGLNGEREQSFKEIGKHFGVTSECVRQTVNNSLAKMKQNAVCSDNFMEYKNIIK